MEEEAGNKGNPRMNAALSSFDVGQGIGCTIPVNLGGQVSTGPTGDLSLITWYYPHYHSQPCLPGGITSCWKRAPVDPGKPVLC